MMGPQGGALTVGGGQRDTVDLFLQLSVMLTGFDEHELLGTGMLQAYYDELLRIVGAREAGSLLSAFAMVPARNNARFEEAVLNDDRYGPVARGVLMMWYLGAWIQLPREWRDEYGATAFDTDHVISADAYREGLVWPAARTHPMGAKQPGFGTWAEAPPGTQNPSAAPGPGRTHD